MSVQLRFIAALRSSIARAAFLTPERSVALLCSALCSALSARLGSATAHTHGTHWSTVTEVIDEQRASTQDAGTRGNSLCCATLARSAPLLRLCTTPPLYHRVHSSTLVSSVDRLVLLRCLCIVRGNTRALLRIVPRHRIKIASRKRHATRGPATRRKGGDRFRFKRQAAGRPTLDHHCYPLVWPRPNRRSSAHRQSAVALDLPPLGVPSSPSAQSPVMCISLASSAAYQSLTGCCGCIPVHRKGSLWRYFALMLIATALALLLRFNFSDSLTALFYESFKGCSTCVGYGQQTQHAGARTAQRQRTPLSRLSPMHSADTHHTGRGSETAHLSRGTGEEI